MKSDATKKYIVLLMGTGFLIVALILFVNTRNFLKGVSSTEGIVTELVRRKSSSSTAILYRPVVEFKTKDGSIVEFTSSTGSNPPRYAKGDSIVLYYNETFPEQATIDEFFPLWGPASIMGGFGTLFFLVGLLRIVSGRTRDIKVEYLKENGVAIKARFQVVKKNRALVVNNRHPYKIYVQWMNPATSKVYVFSSKNIWFDPTAYIKTDELTVLIEPDNPKKYHVDVSFLPDAAT